MLAHLVSRVGLRSLNSAHTRLVVTKDGVEATLARSDKHLLQLLGVRGLIGFETELRHVVLDYHTLMKRLVRLVVLPHHFGRSRGGPAS